MSGSLAAPNAGNLLIGKGLLSFDRFDASGLSTGESPLGNCTAFEISTTDDVKEKYSSMDHIAGLLKRVAVKRTIEIKITCDEFNKENIALALMGTSGAFTQSAVSAFTARAIAATTIGGRWYRLGLRNVTVTAVKYGVSPSTAVLGDDYTVDAVRGRIYIVPGGDLDNAATVIWDGSATAISTGVDKVAGGAATTIEGYLRYIGDPIVGPAQEVEVWKVQVETDGAVPFISEDFAEFTLKLTAYADTANHPTEPYYRVLYPS